MTKREAGFLFALVLLMGLAGRVDMQASQRDAEDVREAQTAMAARAAENKCGQQVAVKRRDGWACVPLKRSM